MKAFLFYSIFWLVGHYALSQTVPISNLDILLDQHTLEKNRLKAIDRDRYTRIEGSPFLLEEFLTGTVVINDSIRYENVPLRYNIFTDKIEFQDTRERVLEVNTARGNQFTFKFDQFHFKHLEYKESNNQNATGLLELLVDGDLKLYRKYHMIIEERTKPIGFQDAQPNRFVKRGSQLLIGIRDETPILFQRRRDLLNKLEDANINIDDYLQNNRIRIRSKESLTDLVKHVNNQSIN